MLPMKIYKNTEPLWVEKYAPQILEDAIFPIELKKMLYNDIKEDKLSNLLMVSKTPGLGKSNLSKIIANELKTEILFINASLHGNLDTLRSKIMSYAVTNSFEAKKKIIVLDEIDGSNSQGFQTALRGFIDTFSQNCIFILTANNKDKIIEPLQNRLKTIDFDHEYITNKKQMVKDLTLRLQWILDNENVEYDIKDIAQIVLSNFPSIRSSIIYAQNAVKNGVLKIDMSELETKSAYNDLMKDIKSKDFTQMRNKVSTIPNKDNFYMFLWDHLYDYYEPSNAAQATLVIAKYQYQSTMVIDKEICLAACCVELSPLEQKE